LNNYIDNFEVIEKLRNSLRGFSFKSKMEMCRNIAHLIDDCTLTKKLDKRNFKDPNFNIIQQ